MKSKVGKLLCLIIISIFIIGFGGERVNAAEDSITVRNAYSDERSISFRRDAYGNPITYFVHIVDDEGDVYCLNSAKNFPGTGKVLTKLDNLVPKNKVNGVIQIIRKGKELGLSSDENYYITQAAVWYYIYGIKPNGQDGITQGFYNWVTHSKYSDEWEELMGSLQYAKELNKYTFALDGNDNTLHEEGENLVSGGFKVSSTGIEGNYTVTIDEGSTSGACIQYRDKCESSVEVQSGIDFKIIVPKPSDASGTANAGFTVKPINNPTVYELLTYGAIDPLDVSSNLQNVGKVISKKKNLSIKKNVTGDYVNNTDVSLQKIDSETGKKVAGASFDIFNESGVYFGNYITTGEGEANVTVSLPNGTYKLSEFHAPEGYVTSDEVITFTVRDGNVEQNGVAVTSATISMNNHPIKAKFRKVDDEGNPIKGVKFIITDYSLSMINPGANKGFCAKSDENGYLTVPCNDSDYESGIIRPTVDGVYVLGKDFGNPGLRGEIMFQIVEVCDDDSCGGYDSSLYVGANELYMEFGKFISMREYIEIDDSDTSSVPVVTINLKNKTKMDVVKVDKSSGNKLGGAKLVIKDKSIPEMIGDKKNDNVVHEWVSSSDKSEVISGIKFNHRYNIEEVSAPEGYIILKSSFDFELKENGDVIVYDPESGEELPQYKSTNYLLSLPNDFTKVQISKVDAVSSEELPGAKLKICTSVAYDESGLDCAPSKPEWTWTSGTTPNYIDKLPAGKYYLIEEIAPEGYIKQTSAQDFTVLENGELQSFKMENKPTKLVISKKDFTTGEEIEGAHLQVLTEDRNVATDVYGNKTEWDSTKEPHEIYGLRPGKYILVETLPANNYDKDMIIDGKSVNEFEFTIVEGEPLTKIDVFNEVLKEVPSTGISTLNLFAIGGLMIFVGYEIIKIYRRKEILK